MGKKSNVRKKRKMGKCQRSAVEEKWEKIKGPQSKKNGKKSKVRGQSKLENNQRSAIREKWEKVKGPLSEKNK